MTNPILLSYLFDGNGNGTPLEENTISTQLADSSLAWVHLDATHPQTLPWLEKEVSYLDNFILEALLAEETRPRMIEHNEGVLIILRGVNLNENAAPEDMVSIRIWIDAHRIISVRRRRLKAIGDIEEQIAAGNAPKNSGDFITMLIGRLFARMESTLANLDDRTDAIEEDILDNPTPQLREAIIHVRKQAIIFRRYMAPQRDAIGQLNQSNAPWLTPTHKRSLTENWNHITRYIEDLDAIRERAQIVKDELANILADRLNKNMYVLSVIAAIFLPLGFLTGLLGINVGGIPGSENQDAFFIFSGILTLIVAVQIILFKKLKWF